MINDQRHTDLREVAERQRRHLDGDHRDCRPGTCPARRTDQPHTP